MTFPWAVDDVTRDERNALHALDRVASKDIELAKLAASLPWFTDDVTLDERETLDALERMASRDIELARLAASLPWFADDVTGDKRNALRALERMASKDIELAKLAASLPWFTDDVTLDEQNALHAKDCITSKDIELGKTITMLPWFGDDGPIDEWNGLHALDCIVSKDIELAKLAASLLWFGYGLTYYEYHILSHLGGIATKDTELARLIASFPWFADGSFDGEDALVALRDLGRIAFTDIELARKMAGIWLADGVSRYEANSLGYLDDLASRDIELARRIAVLSRFADDVTEDESAALRFLNTLAASDIELAREISEFSWFADRGTFITPTLASLTRLASLETDALIKLTGQPWFADGLDEEEAALVVTLGWVAPISPSLYADLLQTHYTQYRAVSLPMAGDVNIWVFQNTPFPPDEDLLTVIEDTARISEGFLGVPFPMTDIILLVVDDVDRRYGFNYAKHLSSFMVVTRGPSGLRERSVRHETAHYYFGLGPQWLSEGGANFIVAYVKDRTGVQPIADRMAEMSQKVQSQCFDLHEIENIRHFTYLWGRERHICPYVLGENLLLNVLDIIGEDAMVSALGELYSLMLARELSHGSEGEKEDLVFDTFVKHIPAERMEEFRDLYRRLHGGPYEEPGVDFSDDHGDEAAAATEVVVGEAAEGTLEYHFDFDYFKFRAEESQQYLISVNHETLPFSSILLYGPDGQTRERYLDRTRVSSGPQMRWIAPASGDYYFAVQNFGGKSGPYTTTITSVATASDDHGDTPATATNISVKDVVRGSIDYPHDIDIFRFEVVEGRRYWANLEFGTLKGGGLILYKPLYISSGKPSHSISWPALNPGYHYYIVIGLNGAVGSYTLQTDGEVVSSE